MTDHTKSAGEVEARKVAAIAVCSQRIDNMCTGDENPADVDEWKLCGPDEEDRMLANAAIDAYLAKLTPTKAEPSRIAEQFVALEEFLGGVDGYDLTHWHEGEGGTTGIDHGTCDAGDAFKAMEAIKAHITAIEADRAKLEQELSVWKTEEEAAKRSRPPTGSFTMETGNTPRLAVMGDNRISMEGSHVHSAALASANPAGRRRWTRCLLQQIGRSHEKV